LHGTGRYWQRGMTRPVKTSPSDLKAALEEAEAELQAALR
jgi:hypothetical protein